MKIDVYQCDICGKEFRRNPGFSGSGYPLSLKMKSNPSYTLHFEVRGYMRTDCMITGGFAVDVCDHCLAQEFLKEA